MTRDAFTDDLINDNPEEVLDLLHQHAEDLAARARVLRLSGEDDRADECIEQANRLIRQAARYRREMES